MSIRIEILADTVPELVSVLKQMAAELSGGASLVALDTARQITDPDNASSGDLEDAQAGSVKRRGRPPKAKDDVPPEPAAAEPDEAPEELGDVLTYIAILTDKFRNGDTNVRNRIRWWRDNMELKSLSEMKNEHLPAARAFVRDLERTE